MAIMVDSKGKAFEPTPLGTVPAVCVFVEDVGLQANTMFGGAQRKVIVCWELAERMSEGDNAGKPFMISRIYTASLNEKANLRHDLESWRGRVFTPEELAGFDVEKLKGVNALLTIVENVKANGDKFAKVTAVSPPIKGSSLLVVENTEPPKWIGEMRAKAVQPEDVSADHREDTTRNGNDDLPF